jgi:hypothetical protein
MDFENTCNDLNDCIDQIVDEGIDDLVDLKHARRLAKAAQKYLDAMEEFENNFDESELVDEDEDSYDDDDDSDEK